MNGQKIIHVDRLHPHPRSIREDLGNLTETAAPICWETGIREDEQAVRVTLRSVS